MQRWFEKRAGFDSSPLLFVIAKILDRVRSLGENLFKKDLHVRPGSHIC
jgi:hypothetical protein